ncbi:hypothetical protein EMPG_17181 [Blastomyces silverae]|uniref:Uncharacterized protein n=1 Tax=Blastomyces silverae TaxID=2060906 RepID=A0A0H1B8G1_9EURO|nr:hypothetical protein EMPG_17181 [Blastomyces silverae]
MVRILSLRTLIRGFPSGGQPCLPRKTTCAKSIVAKGRERRIHRCKKAKPLAMSHRVRPIVGGIYPLSR